MNRGNGGLNREGISLARRERFAQMVKPFFNLFFVPQLSILLRQHNEGTLSADARFAP